MRCHWPRTTTDSRSVTDAAAASRAAVGELVASSSNAPSPRPAPNPVVACAGHRQHPHPRRDQSGLDAAVDVRREDVDDVAGREQRNRLGVRDPHRRGDETGTEPAQRRRPHQPDVGEHLSPAYGRDHRPPGRFAAVRAASRAAPRRRAAAPAAGRRRPHVAPAATSRAATTTGTRAGEAAPARAGRRPPSRPAGRPPAAVVARPRPGGARAATGPAGRARRRPASSRARVTAGRTGASGRRSRAGTRSRRRGRAGAASASTSRSRTPMMFSANTRSTSSWVTPSPCSRPASRSVTSATDVKQSPSSRARDASGTPVMPTTDQPCAACHSDSARVENRGPLTTTRVPPSTTGSPRSRPAASATCRPFGQ